MNETKDFFDYDDFRAVLTAEYEKRRGGRNSYSLRAFARDLDLKPSTLVDSLNGHIAFSMTTANKVASKLRYSEKKQKFFCDLISSKHARSKSERESASLRLQKYRALPDYLKLSADALELCSKWYYVAILELITLKEGLVTAGTIAKSLGITTVEASDALDRLCRANIISKQKRIYVRSANYYLAESATPSEVIRSFHKQMLDLAKAAIDAQPIAERQYMSSIFSFDSSRTEDARKAIEKFHFEFFREFEEGRSADSLYGVTFQLFRIDQKGS